MELKKIVLIVVIVLVVLNIFNIGMYVFYRSVSHGLPSGRDMYLVSSKFNLNFDEITTFDSIVNTWKDTFIIKFECNAINSRSTTQLFKNGKMGVMFDGSGRPYTIALSSKEQSIVAFKSGSKKLLMKFKLKDDSDYSPVQFGLYLEGCPNGIVDFTLDEMKKFPRTINMKWYTLNSKSQSLAWSIKPLFTSQDVINGIPNVTTPDENGHMPDTEISIDVNVVN
jgi:hypothetical protein